jgi:apolipoprotein N-acyltransferase
VFLLFGGQVLLALLLLFRRKTDMANQILLVAGLLLFLFAFVYAKNASMDYVQRFIANKGQISLAENTATEQLYALFRFGPFLLVNLWLLVWPRIRASRRRRQGDDAPGSSGVLSDNRLLSVAGSDAGSHTIAAFSRTWALPLVMGAALLYSLAFPSFVSLAGIPYLAWICLVPLFLAVIFSNEIRGIFLIVAFGAVTTLILNYWHGTYSYVSLAFSVILSSVFYLLFAPVFVLTVKRLGRWGFVAAPVLWLAFEYARSVGYIGYPWGYFGVSQYSFVPIIQVADLAGVWAVTFILVLWNSGIAWSLASRDAGWIWSAGVRRARGGSQHKDWLLAGGRWVPAAAGAGLALLALVYGAFRLIPPVPEDAETMRVVLVQQNTDPRKHDYRQSFEMLQEQTNAALAESYPRVPDLIVWPEGGFKPDIRYWLDRPASRSTSAVLVGELFEYTATLGTSLVTGSQDHVYLDDGEGGEVKRNFNSSVLISGAEIVEIYHKMHLVPFTEHFPYKEEFPWLAELLDKFDTSNWKQGEERIVYENPVANFFTPICFEDIFPSDLRHFVLGGGEVIVNMSNDYWSLTPVEGKQHAVHSMFRAVENRRPMVRATCSGLTTYITAEGRMSNNPPAFYTPGYLMVDIPILDRGTTLYTRAGDWFPWFCILAGGAAVLFLLVRGIVQLVAGFAARRRDRP